jgi:hypothetical protein
VPIKGLDFEFAATGLLKVTLTSPSGNVFVSYITILNGEEAVWR